MDDVLDTGYREATVFVKDVLKILADPDLRKKVTPDRMQVLTDFKSAAMEMGMEPDGMREVTRVMKAYLRGECTEFVEDFQ